MQNRIKPPAFTSKKTHRAPSHTGRTLTQKGQCEENRLTHAHAQLRIRIARHETKTKTKRSRSPGYGGSHKGVLTPLNLRYICIYTYKTTLRVIRRFRGGRGSQIGLTLVSHRSHIGLKSLSHRSHKGFTPISHRSRSSLASVSHRSHRFHIGLT